MAIVRKTLPPDEQGFDDFFERQSKVHPIPVSLVMFFLFDGDYAGSARRIANILSAAVRPIDTVGRTQPHEFVICVGDWRDSQLPTSLCERLCQALEVLPYGTGIAVSYAIFPFDGMNVDKLRIQAQRTGLMGRCDRGLKGH